MANYVQHPGWRSNGKNARATIDAALIRFYEEP